MAQHMYRIELWIPTRWWLVRWWLDDEFFMDLNKKNTQLWSHSFWHHHKLYSARLCSERTTSSRWILVRVCVPITRFFSLPDKIISAKCKTKQASNNTEFSHKAMNNDTKMNMVTSKHPGVVFISCLHTGQNVPHFVSHESTQLEWNSASIV